MTLPHLLLHLFIKFHFKGLIDNLERKFVKIHAHAQSKIEVMRLRFFKTITQFFLSITLKCINLMPDILTKTKKELKWIKYKKFMKMIHTKSRNQMFWSFTRYVLIDTIRAICNSNNIRKTNTY